MEPKTQIDFLIEEFFNTGKLNLNGKDDGITFDQLDSLHEMNIQRLQQITQLFEKGDKQLGKDNYRSAVKWWNEGIKLYNEEGSPSILRDKVEKYREEINRINNIRSAARPQLQSTPVEAIPAAPTPQPTGIPTLSKDTEVPDEDIIWIEILQHALGIREDGEFGEVTKEEVKKFQRDNNLTETGMVNRETWRELFNNTKIKKRYDEKADEADLTNLYDLNPDYCDIHIGDIVKLNSGDNIDKIKWRISNTYGDKIGASDDQIRNQIEEALIKKIESYQNSIKEIIGRGQSVPTLVAIHKCLGKTLKLWDLSDSSLRFYKHLKNWVDDTTWNTIKSTLRINATTFIPDSTISLPGDISPEVEGICKELAQIPETIINRSSGKYKIEKDNHINRWIENIILDQSKFKVIGHDDTHDNYELELVDRPHTINNTLIKIKEEIEDEFPRVEIPLLYQKGKELFDEGTKIERPAKDVYKENVKCFGKFHMDTSEANYFPDEETDDTQHLSKIKHNIIWDQLWDFIHQSQKEKIYVALGSEDRRVVDIVKEDKDIFPIFKKQCAENTNFCAKYKCCPEKVGGATLNRDDFTLKDLNNPAYGFINIQFGRFVKDYIIEQEKEFNLKGFFKKISDAVFTHINQDQSSTNQIIKALKSINKGIKDGDISSSQIKKFVKDFQGENITNIDQAVEELLASQPWRKYENSFSKNTIYFERTTAGDKSTLGDVINIKTLVDEIYESNEETILVERAIDRLYGSIVNDQNTTQHIEKHDIKCIKEVGDIIDTGDLIEVKYFLPSEESSSDSFLSEFISLYKDSDIYPEHEGYDPKYFEEQYYNIHNKIIDGVVNKLRSDGDGGILDIIRQTMSGIFIRDYIFIPINNIDLYWSNRGSWGCKDHRITIRYRVTSNNNYKLVFSPKKVSTQTVQVERFNGISNINGAPRFCSNIIAENRNEVDKYISEALGF